MGHPLPAWLDAQLQSLLQRRSHALLLEGPSGLGQLDLALALASAWLCESPRDDGTACGVCQSCHLVAAHTHPDLMVLMPETLMLELGWSLDEDAQQKIEEGKRKPSKDIRIEALRAAIDFSQISTARGRGKVVLLYPAERMNHVSANALLKTLEEPPGQVRFVLASEASHLLLPTIRSRCQSHRMAWPDASVARQWLSEHHPDAAGLLDAAGQRPGGAVDLAVLGFTPERWAHLPKAVVGGQSQAVEGLSVRELVEVLQKLCHDLWLKAVGAQPRFFSHADLPQAPALAALQRWQVSLAQHARVAEHPLQVALQTQNLMAEAQAVLKSRL
jgi:DNA polymerase III subunit delta'